MVITGPCVMLILDIWNNGFIKPSKVVATLRIQTEPSPLAAIVALFLSPISSFDPRLEKPVFSAAQKAVYVPTSHPLFLRHRTPNFSLILSIIKFFQHHLDHMRHRIGAITREALSWANACGDGEFAFQPAPPVTKYDFDDDPSKVEGVWIGLYSYLGWADFEALRDGNPAVLEANAEGNLKDYLGGPQQLTIRIAKSDEKTSPGGGMMFNITGDGINGGAFTFVGKLRRVYLPGDVFGEDMHLYWRITFVKTYANGENSWTRWIYDGIYCPGITLASWL